MFSNRIKFIALIVTMWFGGSVQAANGTKAKNDSNNTLAKNKYAGAVIFELGKTSSDLDFNNRSPVSRLYFCIDRSGQARTGDINFHLPTLGVAPYRAVLGDPAETKPRRYFDLGSLNINFEMRGEIKANSVYAWGDIEFKSEVRDQKWQPVITTNGEQSAVSIDTMTLRLPFDYQTYRNGIHDGPFRVEYYQVADVTYYVFVYAPRFFKTHGSDPTTDIAVEVCEKENNVTFVKTLNDIKR